jgi:23S rRNA (guanine745-N1)-methyltransferase
VSGPTTGEQRFAALDAALEVLACPVCLEALARTGRGIVCASGHAFDVARQGYLAFATGAAAHGDTGPMVRARAEFLAAGHYDRIADRVAGTVEQASGWCLDLAGGTGHYLARVLDARPGLRGIGLDASAPAARAAAGAHPRAASVTADLWRRIPVRSAAAHHVLDVFGPRNGPEIERVLAPGGRVTVVTPAPGHLAELRDRFGTLGIAPGKERRLDEQLSPLRLVGRTGLEYRLDLPAADVARAVLMGPSGHHLDFDAVTAEAAATTVTVAVTVSVFAHG